MSHLPRTTAFLVAMIVANCAMAQIAWSTIPAPPNQGVFAYDSLRDRIVCVDWISTSEFDGSSWSSVAAPWASVAWIEYDESRGRTLLPVPTTTGASIWEWDGTAWTWAGTANSAVLSASETAYHRGLGQVVVGVHGAQDYELYAWDGISFTQLPSTVAPPIHPPFSNNTYWYSSLCYDAASDRIVLFGRREFDQGGFVASASITWEWDPTNGWVNLGASGTMLSGSTIWYDAHRGAVVRFDEGSGTVRAAYVRQSGGTWSPLSVQGAPRLGDWGCHDWRRNRYYIWWGTQPSTPMGYLGDIHPSAFDPHAPGCAATGSPTLGLTAPWTRAWLGGNLSLDIGNLTSPIAILTMGFDDQSFNSNPLPLSLGAYGMPQCALNVAAEASTLALAVNNTATVSIPIPNSSPLIGLRYFQQAFAPVPGANPLGMLASDSVTGTVGKSQ